MERYISNEKETLALGDRLAHGVHHGALILISGNTGSGKTTLMRGILHGLGVLVSKSRIGSTFINTIKSHDMVIHCCDFYSLTDSSDPNFVSAIQHLSEERSLRIVESPERASASLPPADLHIKFRPGLKGRTINIEALTEVGSTIASHVNPRH